MNISFADKRLAIVTAIIIVAVAALTKCTGSEQVLKTGIKNLKGQEYAGTASCRNCHREIYDSFNETRHHHGSAPASEENIKGSFSKNENILSLDSSQRAVMEKRAGGLYQVAYVNGKEELAERFDITIGTGKHGQTYLYWNNNSELYQLPMSYSANMHYWANSPGYANDKIFFDRLIEARCLECHITFAKQDAFFGFDRNQVIYGIDCERCHGPAANHVEFHTAHTGEKQGKFIINPASLSREVSLDVCAVCHSGIMQSKTNAFSFMPGDTLSQHFYRNPKAIDSVTLDVHANQYGLLTASKCFRMSGTMTCNSCHNTHVKENGNLAAYAPKCMNCHNQSNHNFCTLQPKAGFSMEANCINCHMPQMDSKNIIMSLSPELVRTHRIGIYPEATKKWLQLGE